jgi:hypothetical protein
VNHWDAWKLVDSLLADLEQAERDRGVTQRAWLADRATIAIERHEHERVAAELREALDELGSVCGYHIADVIFNGLCSLGAVKRLARRESDDWYARFAVLARDRAAEPALTEPEGGVEEIDCLADHPAASSGTEET